jgi:hypothetical protein
MSSWAVGHAALPPLPDEELADDPLVEDPLADDALDEPEPPPDPPEPSSAGGLPSPHATRIELTARASHIV